MLEKIVEHECELPKIKETEHVPATSGMWWWKKAYTRLVIVWEEDRHLLFTCPDCQSKWEYDPERSYIWNYWQIKQDNRAKCKRTVTIATDPLTSTRQVP